MATNVSWILLHIFTYEKLSPFSLIIYKIGITFPTLQTGKINQKQKVRCVIQNINVQVWFGTTYILNEFHSSSNNISKSHLSSVKNNSGGRPVHLYSYLSVETSAFQAGYRYPGTCHPFSFLLILPYLFLFLSIY